MSRQMGKTWQKLRNPHQNYQYTPLSMNKIRILRLHPGRFDSPLVITLEQYDIHAIKDMYEALSYAWHDPARKINIECNGGTLKITSSLETSLRHLRRSDEFRVLWIDAICINQDDEEERAHQVPLMRDIYPKAATVIIWLGEEDRKTELALTVIDQWADFNRKYRDNSDATRYAKFEEKFAFKPGYSDSLEAVGALTHRSWFNRCWTFQEILLSTNAELCVGKRSLTWDTFHYALVAFPVHLLVEEKLNFNALFMCYGKSKIENANFTKTKLPISRNLSRLLQITRNFIASDARDKIYSMLSIATLNDPSIFKPQYSMSVQKTYISFTLAMIRDENSLNVLMSTGEPRRDKRLPSWCPDWRCSRSVTLIGYYDYMSYTVNGNLHPKLKNLQMSAHNELVLGGTLIDVVKEVHDLEDLEEELETFKKKKDCFNFTPVLTKFAHKFGLQNRRLRRELSPEAALLRTLSADHWFFGAHVQGSYKELWFPTHLRFWDLKRNKVTKSQNDSYRYTGDFLKVTTIGSSNFRDPQSIFFPGQHQTDFVENIDDSTNVIKSRPTNSRNPQATFVCSQDQNGDFWYSNRETESLFTHSVIDKVYRQTSPYYIEGQDFDEARHVDMHTLIAISREALSQALFFSKGKRIIITKRGYVALGTVGTTVGDSICSFWGADVPFIMREKKYSTRMAADNPWEIISECYIDGLMHGEIFRDSNRSSKEQKNLSAVPSLVEWVQARRFVVS